MRLERHIGFYERYVKRLLDFFGSLVFIILFWWVYVIVATLVLIWIGHPVLFRQPRPGIVRNGEETIFDMYKFRTMTNERDDNGNLLPDSQRLPKFGALLRSTSLDELPELFCILLGTMSFIGPRPQLVRDMVFMSEAQRMRHTAKPGLTGLAQVNGRNAIKWEEKLDWDLKYIENVTFKQDLTIAIETVAAVFKRKGITDGENATALDYGDVLLKENKISKETYDTLQSKAKRIIGSHEGSGHGTI